MANPAGPSQVASTGISGFGTAVGYQDSTGGTVTWFANLQNVGGPDAKDKDVDLTHMFSPEGWEEQVPGLINGGNVSITIQYEKTQEAAVLALLRVKKTFWILYPDGAGLSFPGYINGFGQKSEKDSAITQDITIKVAGKPTFSAA
jgi:hypothetical protein